MRDFAIFKKCINFSVSEQGSFFLAWLGPIFLLLTFLVGLPFGGNLFLPITTTVGLALSARFKGVGFSLTMLVFFLYFGVAFLFGFQEVSLWNVSWGLSLVFGLIISFFSLSELQSNYRKYSEEKKAHISALKNDLQSAEELSRSEKKIIQIELERAQEKLAAAEKQAPLLLNLVEASHVEAEKSFKQNQMLSQKSLEDFRIKASLENLLGEEQEQLGQLKEQNQKLLKKYQDNLGALNASRVELYQAALLLEECKKRLEMDRQGAFDQSSYSNNQPQKKLEGFSLKTVSHLLQTLHNEKIQLKKSYALHLQELQAVKYDLEKRMHRGEEDFSQIHKLAFEKKRKKLEEVKLQLTIIERKIFVTKKEMQQKGVSVSS